MARSDHDVVTVGARGRLVVPARLRRRLGLAPGAQLVAYDDDGRLVLEPWGRLLARLQADARNRTGGRRMVPELLAERRAEAAREDAATASSA